MSARLFAAALVALAAASPARAEPIALDRFLAGFHDQCRQTEALQTFKTTMISAKGGWRLTRQTEIPAEIVPAIGRAEIVETNAEEGTVTVAVPVSGATYRGLPVKALRFGFARGYPLIDDAIVFATDLGATKAALVPDLSAFDPAVAGEIVEFTLTDEADGPTLRCFATN